MPSEATLYDGVDARAHTVAVRVDRDRLVLELHDPDAPPRCPLAWPLASSHPTAEGRADRLTVTTRLAPDARLVIEDAALRAAVAPVLNRAARRTGQGRAAARWAVALGAAIVVIVAAGGLMTRHAAELLPAGWGGRLSDGLLEQLGELHPACTGAAGVAALDRLAARMSASLDLPPPRVVTVQWGLVNAFALPGGRVVLTSGLIAGTGRPEAVAAVLAHEIGHVARRDPLARLLRDKLVDVAVAAVFGVSVGWAGTGTVAAFLLDGSYTREQESAADTIAIAILNDLDIASGPGSGFFDALARKESGLDGVTLLRSHPLSGERAAELRRRGTGTGAGLTAAEWRAVRDICG